MREVITIPNIYHNLRQCSIVIICMSTVNKINDKGDIQFTSSIMCRHAIIQHYVIKLTAAYYISVLILRLLRILIRSLYRVNNLYEGSETSFINSALHTNVHHSNTPSNRAESLQMWDDLQASIPNSDP